MKSKNLLLGILAIALVFAMTAVGCDSGGSFIDTGNNTSNNSGTGTNTGGTSTATSTGSMTVVNSSGYDIMSVWISQNSQTKKTLSPFKKGSSWTYKDLPAGSYDILAQRAGTTSTFKWRKNGVTVPKGGTITVTILSSGWTTN